MFSVFSSSFIHSFVQCVLDTGNPKKKETDLLLLTMACAITYLPGLTMGKLLISLNFSYSVCKVKAISLLYSLLGFWWGLTEVTQTTQCLSYILSAQ